MSKSSFKRNLVQVNASSIVIMTCSPCMAWQKAKNFTSHFITLASPGSLPGLSSQEISQVNIGATSQCLARLLTGAVSPQSFTQCLPKRREKVVCDKGWPKQHRNRNVRVPSMPSSWFNLQKAWWVELWSTPLPKQLNKTWTMLPKDSMSPSSGTLLHWNMLGIWALAWPGWWPRSLICQTHFRYTYLWRDVLMTLPLQLYFYHTNTLQLCTTRMMAG